MENVQNANVSLKPSEVSRGKGLGYIPAAVDPACAHMERLSSVISKARSKSILYAALSGT